MSQDFQTLDILKTLDADDRNFCLGFCAVFGYDLELFEYGDGMKENNQQLFGFSLYPKSTTVETLLYSFDSLTYGTLVPSKLELVNKVRSAMRNLISKLGETDASFRMKAQLMGFAV